MKNLDRKLSEIFALRMRAKDYESISNGIKLLENGCMIEIKLIDQDGIIFSEGTELVLRLENAEELTEGILELARWEMGHCKQQLEMTEITLAGEEE